MHILDQLICGYVSNSHPVFTAALERTICLWDLVWVKTSICKQDSTLIRQQTCTCVGNKDLRLYFRSYRGTSKWLLWFICHLWNSVKPNSNTCRGGLECVSAHGTEQLRPQRLSRVWSNLIPQRWCLMQSSSHFPFSWHWDWYPNTSSCDSESGHEALLCSCFQNLYMKAACIHKYLVRMCKESEVINKENCQLAI